MRSILLLTLCLICVTTQAQPLRSKIELHSVYMPKFTVQEASDHNVQAFGVRWMVSNYNKYPFEAGFKAYIGYGDVANISYGVSLAYRFANPGMQNLKLGLSLSRIQLKDVDQNKSGIGPNVGDVRFINPGIDFKPYAEWQWDFSRFSSLIIQSGYHFIHGEKSVVTAVEPTDDPIVDRQVTKTDESFFFTASGLEFGLALSINIY